MQEGVAVLGQPLPSRYAPLASYITAAGAAAGSSCQTSPEVARTHQFKGRPRAVVVAADLNSEGSKDYVVSSAGGGTLDNALPDSVHPLLS